MALGNISFDDWRYRHRRTAYLARAPVYCRFGQLPENGYDLKPLLREIETLTEVLMRFNVFFFC